MQSVVFNSSIGKLKLISSGGALIRIEFAASSQKLTKITDEFLLGVKKEIESYLLGEKTLFQSTLLMQGTEFQKKVWQVVMGIPYGETLTYKEIAKKVGSPKAFRAVGMACNSNPIPVIVPCHRVLGSHYKLVGYAGGVDIKKKLLSLEGAQYCE